MCIQASLKDKLKDFKDFRKNVKHYVFVGSGSGSEVKKPCRRIWIPIILILTRNTGPYLSVAEPEPQGVKPVLGIWLEQEPEPNFQLGSGCGSDSQSKKIPTDFSTIKFLVKLLITFTLYSYISTYTQSLKGRNKPQNCFKKNIFICYNCYL